MKSIRQAPLAIKQKGAFFVLYALRRSAGGVMSLLDSSHREKWAHDERILGNSLFVMSIFKKTEPGALEAVKKSLSFYTLNPRSQLLGFWFPLSQTVS